MIFWCVDIRAEMQPDDKPDVSEVARFDSGILKHVSTEEKDVKPTQEGMIGWRNVFPCPGLDPECGVIHLIFPQKNTLKSS